MAKVSFFSVSSAVPVFYLTFASFAPSRFKSHYCNVPRAAMGQTDSTTPSRRP
jgi:hypothetical protein